MLAGFFGGWEILLILLVLFMIPLCLLAFVFWIVMLIDCIRSRNISSNEKIAWVVVIALTHFLGALIYFFAGRNRSNVTTAPPMV